MKISVIVRTRDEAANIDRFCQSYSWADRILIADGGSLDKTVSLAMKYRNVRVRPFLGKVGLKSKLWRNPQGEHINLLIEWAEEISSDWIVFSDCDEYPSAALIQQQRELFETTEQNYIRLAKVFLYHRTSWFPALSKPYDNKYHMHLWAWRGRYKVRAYSHLTGPGYAFTDLPVDDVLYRDVLPPMALLHDAWPDDRTIERKLNFYRKSGVIPEMLHPEKFGGPMAPLEPWMN